MPRGSKPGERRGGRKPGSVNKVTKDIRALAQVHTDAAITELARLAKHAESEAARVAAIKELLDRGHGKSAQAITGEGGEGAVRQIIEVITGVPRGGGT